MANQILVQKNGSLKIEGQIQIVSSSGDVIFTGNETWLCRCGLSQNKPFCDGSHKQAGFTEPGAVLDDKAEELDHDAELTITVRENAMLIANGPVTIVSADGTQHTTRNKAALCRCGASARKPFCDASHKKCGFTG